MFYGAEGVDIEFFLTVARIARSTGIRGGGEICYRRSSDFSSARESVSSSAIHPPPSLPPPLAPHTYFAVRERAFTGPFLLSLFLFLLVRGANDAFSKTRFDSHLSSLPPSFLPIRAASVSPVRPVAAECFYARARKYCQMLSRVNVELRVAAIRL